MLQSPPPPKSVVQVEYVATATVQVQAEKEKPTESVLLSNAVETTSPSSQPVIPVAQAPSLDNQVYTSAALLGPPITVGSKSPQSTEPEILVASVSNLFSDSWGTNTQNQEFVNSPNLANLEKSEENISGTPQENLPVPNYLIPSLELESSSLNQGRKITHLLTQERGGERREFKLEIPAPVPETPTNSETESPPIIEREEAQPTETFETPGVIEITADSQQYDDQRQVITAEGNVEMRFSGAVLTTDRLEVNVANRIAVAQGDVALVRGEQILRGERFEYFFVQDSGVILNASGAIYQPSLTQDTSANLPTDPNNSLVPARPLSDRLLLAQPLRRVTTNEGYSFVIGTSRDIGPSSLPESGGTINRFRFQAERVEFDAKSWRATNVRITNDPFSPPELEVIADTAEFRNIGPLQDELTTTNSRIVFDDNVSLPIFQDRIVFDRRPRQPGIVSFRYDGSDRGGLYAERSFDIIDNEQVSFKLTPQYFLQKALFEEGPFDLSVLGLKSELDVILGPRTNLEGQAIFTSLNPSELDDELRASLRLQQIIGTELPHTLNLEYSYRDRLFNGSLGFQTVQSSFGAVITSPVIALGNTGVDLSYQAGVQQITAESDREDLIEEDEGTRLATLTRYQAAASVNRGFLLWQGEALPATPTEGLRYTPVPVLPFLSLKTGLTGVTSYYSNGDSQKSLNGSIGLEGQFGNFSRPVLDYTGFNITYSQALRGDESPFLFDRFADERTLSLGITQQVYGPFLAGFQTSFNLDNNREISTDYFVEYSRRSFNILLRYNPVLEIGSISFRISDFNWLGSPEPYGGTSIRPVVQGVTR
ncbi:DUF3769 domain-containing protein [Oscillatoria salina]|uniref:DUF3769 domain-containing protein n=1 Tax=Oscillatoria salina TaxID=331517 RepID=UPI0013BC8685|nr:DUF3769 domain-containing protein [Oscillatoria salina]MBZ8182335.1 DUF3769 domain-containing protein [Oscillatoria salina IIICB1]NET89986.1 DUF3769 domain-containing protein [Kamptonema sp. SIO1D9]